MDPRSTVARHRTVILAGLTALAALIVLGLYGGHSSVLQADGCRRLDLIDQSTGAPVRGIEDIAVDQGAGMAYLSAQDRWALDRALEAGAAALPQGAIYAISLADLRGAKGSLHVADLAAAFAGGNDFHPHGIDLLVAPSGERLLLAVNRRYARSKGEDWRPAPAVEVFQAGPGQLRHRASLTHPAMCRPNDTAWIDRSQVLVTNDHKTCGGLGRWIEDATGGDGTIVHLTLTDGYEPRDGRVLLDGLPYANGIAVGGTQDRRVLVAATRAKALFDYRLSDLLGARHPPGRPEPVRAFPLAGGPDNITWQDDGDVLIALHTRLFRLALYRGRWFGIGRAPSRVVSLALDDDRKRVATDVVFDDPAGDLLSAATVGARLGELALIGSVADRGLLVCTGRDRRKTRS